MHMQLAILCLLAIIGVVATKNIGGCSSQSCRRYLGVYLLYADTPVENVKEYEVVTLHADGTFNYINSLQDGTLIPEYPAFSNGQGVWKCAGQNRITATSLVFIYPKPGIPRSIVKLVYNFQFDNNDRVSGSAIGAFYDSVSTENQDQSKWIKILQPINVTLNGYKLFDTCDD